MKKIYELKALLKEKASYIRQSRNEACVLKKDGKGWQAHEIHISLIPNSNEYRHYHIAYCELRGRTRDQIEKPREGNSPNESKINKIKELYSEGVENEKTLCVG